MAAPADDLKSVLERLNAAAANFHSTSADVEFDTVDTDPLPDKDVQKGVVYYERKDGSVKMGVHLTEHNSKPRAKEYSFIGGTFKLFEPGINQVTTYAKAGKYESYIILGMGASGKDLQAKWDIKDLGAEALDGVKTERLELVAKDADVRKNLPKVTIWVDTVTGVNLKQVFDEGPGQYRVSVYFNIKVNQPLPADAFTLKTDSKTQFVKR